MKFSFDHKDFEGLSDRTDQPAIVDTQGVMTWGEFRNRVSDLEHFLADQGLHLMDKPVIVYGHKVSEMIVAIYTLIRLEITYIPIDEIYPEDRIRFIIDETETGLIINTTGKAVPFGTDRAVLDMSGYRFRLKGPKPAVVMAAKPEDPIVYIIFTSGSTGKPKGVQISTEAVRSFTQWMCSDFGFSETDRFVNTAIFSFDLSVFELLTFAALGATLILTSREISAQPKAFADWVGRHQGTVLVATPSFVLPFARLDRLPEFDSLRTFLFCGEVLPNMTAGNLLRNFPKARVLNTYGPTEATVATTLVEITPQLVEKYPSLPVGRCKSGTELRIMDGEIVIVGPNVSVGYFKNDALNESKFKRIDGQRAFFTGDIGYFENGQLFFSGRNDDLVKLHGYRIELNEINETINRLDYVSHAATIALKRDDVVKKIVSFVVLMPGRDAVTVAGIRDDLSKSLPPYMVPGDIRITEYIPLNANGKADRKALAHRYLNPG